MSLLECSLSHLVTKFLVTSTLLSLFLFNFNCQCPLRGPSPTAELLGMPPRHRKTCIHQFRKIGLDLLFLSVVLELVS